MNEMRMKMLIATKISYELQKTIIKSWKQKDFSKTQSDELRKKNSEIKIKFK